MGEIAYVAGKLVPLSEAKISIFDRGFLYGDGLFETIRVYEKTPFLLHQHLKRLLSAAEALRINSPGFEELESLVCSVLDANRVENGVLKVILTRGVGQRGLGFLAETEPTLVITLTQGIPYTEDMYKKGSSAVFVPEVRDFGYLKSLSFLANVAAKSFADNCGAQEAFFIKDCLVTEGTMSNIFAVKEGKLITPSLDLKILPGITREHVLNLANELGISSCEKHLLREELEASDEIFITNSILEIMPVVMVEDKKTGNGTPGEITMGLSNKYKESINQYLSNNK